jgi:uncharacterized membrane protein
LTNICAFLGIDTGRLKIVGVKSGSTIVDAIIVPVPVVLNNATTTSLDPVATQLELQQLANSIAAALTGGQVDVGSQVISVNIELVIVNTDGSTYNSPSSKEESNQKLLIIILATAIPGFVILILLSVIGYCYIKRKRERISAVSAESDIDFSSEEEKKPHYKNYKREMIKVA